MRNGVAYLKGEISGKELGINTAKDSAEGAAVSFATGAAGSIIKGVMQNSSSKMVRSLSKTSLPASFVILTKDVGKLVIKYMQGEITGPECIEKIGEQGFGELGASMYSTLTTSAVRASASAGTKMVAGMVGSTCGYLAAMYVYETLSKSIKDYQFAREQRILIEVECDEAVQLIEKYRAEMNLMIEEYLKDYWTQFDEGISAMDAAILNNDSEGFITSNAQIQEILGRKPQFRNQKEFDALMSSEEAFTL